MLCSTKNLKIWNMPPRCISVEAIEEKPKEHPEESTSQDRENWDDHHSIDMALKAKLDRTLVLFRHQLDKVSDSYRPQILLWFKGEIDHMRARHNRVVRDNVAFIGRDFMAAQDWRIMSVYSTDSDWEPGAGAGVGAGAGSG